ncbi:MAG: hypothetical protein ABII02_00555 [Candidatus Magasanikbacteria bacterium]
MKSFATKKQTMREKKMAMKKWVVSAAFRTSLIVCIVVFGVLYLFQTNAVSSRGYELSDLESQIESLEKETQKLEVEISKYRSMESIQERLEGMEMVVAGNIDYVAQRSAVARR